MSPLLIFRAVSNALATRPFAFWSTEDQRSLTVDLIKAIEKLQSALASKDLSGGLAAKQLITLRETVGEGTLQEVPFVQGLRGLLAMYRMTTLPPETTKLLDQTAQSAAKAERMILEHHLALEMLAKNAHAMTEGERKTHDQKHLRETGMFYTLEYTLQVQYECEHRTEDEQRMLLFDGLRVERGNLPSLVSCMSAFRRELCYGIMDGGTREQLLRIFFTLEDVLGTKDVAKIRAALRTFNISLATLLKQSGIERFQARLLTSYGTDQPFDALIEKLQHEFAN